MGTTHASMVAPSKRHARQDSEPASTDGERADEFSLKLLRPSFCYVRDKLGEPSLERVAKAAGVRRQDLFDVSVWISHAQFEAALDALRAEVQDEAEFGEAFTYDMAAAFGPMLYVLRATTPTRIYQIMAATMHLVTTIGRTEVLERSRRHVRIRYTCTRRDGRLNCLSRIAWLQRLPVLWGLPRARLDEHSCMARGDDACIYHIRWYDVASLVPAVVGTCLGVALALGLHFAAALGTVGFASLPLLGAVAGYAFAYRRAAKSNVAYGDESHRALEALADEHASAVIHLRELWGRQQQWSHSLEERLAEKEGALAEVARQIEDVREKRALSLRHITHDLKNPLSVIRCGAEHLQITTGAGSEAGDVLRDIIASAKRMESQLGSMLATAGSDAELFHVQPERLLVRPLVESIRGTLQALVLHRGIKISVFQTREAPDEVSTDKFLFGRIVDNIITNAAKYTAHGSIVVEITGTPGTFCIKCSDTGRGFTSERLEQVFVGGEPDRAPLVGSSHGFGLPIAIRLLDQLGGRLEVMSRPDKGTTFWIHVPVAIPTVPPPRRALPSSEDLVKRVVTVRAANDG